MGLSLLQSELSHPFQMDSRKIIKLAVPTFNLLTFGYPTLHFSSVFSNLFGTRLPPFAAHTEPSEPVYFDISDYVSIKWVQILHRTVLSKALSTCALFRVRQHNAKSDITTSLINISWNEYSSFRESVLDFKSFTRSEYHSLQSVIRLLFSSMMAHSPASQGAQSCLCCVRCRYVQPKASVDSMVG